MISEILADKFLWYFTILLYILFLIFSIQISFSMWIIQIAFCPTSGNIVYSIYILNTAYERKTLYRNFRIVISANYCHWHDTFTRYWYFTPICLHFHLFLIFVSFPTHSLQDTGSIIEAILRWISDMFFATYDYEMFSVNFPIWHIPKKSNKYD